MKLVLKIKITSSMVKTLVVLLYILMSLLTKWNAIP
jgi:hypothetical protein